MKISVRNLEIDKCPHCMARRGNAHQTRACADLLPFEDEIRKLRVENAEAKRVAVWAVRNAVFHSAIPGLNLVSGYLLELQKDHDGTDDGIYRALCEARDQVQTTMGGRDGDRH